MSSTVKRDREWEASASGGTCATPAADTDVKRPRISSALSSLPSDASFTSQRPVLTSGKGSEVHPMAVLDAIRAKLQSTSDPHLQARLLLQYSTAAASPGAKTAAAIDFLFSFLQQNQTQAETQTDGNQKDAGSNGAIVVGAIVRGLRQLLAVKAAVVEPMIQVDAMGEQLMQCMSVGEDFKLRRDMMRIVVDCLMLTKKYKQVETLLHTCVQDHDAGMQAICLRGYLRLHGAGRRFAAETPSSESQGTAADHFDRLAAFVLFAQSEEVRVLAAQVLVALADLHPQHEIASSKFFPTTTTPLLLPEKLFYVLCMAGNDASGLVRVEVARCLRRFSRVLAGGVVEHAVLKTQIDEAVADVAPEIVEMKTRRMMSSGVLLSLLEDVDVDVAAEASRTIARLGEMAMAPDAGIGRWDQRALERAITAHFDVLPRTTFPSASQLCQVLVNSLGRLLVCRQTLDTKSDFIISSSDLSCLFRSVNSTADTIKPAVVEILLVLQHCDLSSSWAVQRLVDFLLETVGSPSFENPWVDDADDDRNSDCSNKRLVDVARDLGRKCAKVLQADVVLSGRVRQEACNSRHLVLKSVSQAILGYSENSNKSSLETTNKPELPSVGSTLFFLKSSQTPTRQDASSSISPQAASSMDTLRVPPVDGNVAVHLKAIHRLRTAFVADQLDASFQFAALLVRLRQHLHSFPDASAAPPPPTAHKYVSMQAMLSTSPSVSSGQTNSTNVGSHDQKEAQAFASLTLPVDLQKGCQDTVDIASDVYVKAFALSSSPRAELLQLILLGRVGLVLALLQNTSDSLLVIEKLRWISKEATRLRFLVGETQQEDVWLPTRLLSDVSSLNDLKRAFVATVRKAWPTALIKAAIARCTPAASGSDVHYRRLAIANASIVEPTPAASAKVEPREITANWPFEQHIRFSLTNVRDITQVYVKSVLPNGDVAYHHVPAGGIRNHGPRRHSAEHKITLTVSPFSDPTAFTVTVCLGHSTLPGSVKPNAPGSGETSPMLYKDISAPVRVPILHRTSSTLRHVAPRTSTA